MAYEVDASDLKRAHMAFSGIAITRGRAYLREGRVEAVRREDDGDDVLYVGRVNGTARYPYEACLAFDGTTGNLVDADCTCPMASYCKHCVAVLGALDQRRAAGALPDPQSRGVGAMPTTLSGRSPATSTMRRPLDPPAPSARRPAEVRGPALDSRLDYWLRMLEVAGQPVGASHRPPEERFLYSLTLAPRGLLAPQLQLRVDRTPLFPDGSYGPRRIVQPAHLDWSRDWAALPGDHTIIVRLGAFSMGYVVLDGSPGARSLSDVIATGRAFLATDGGFTLLVEGARRTGELTFTGEDDGGQRPSIAVPGATHVLPLSPPHYIDASTGAVGPIDVSRVSDELAHAWLTGSHVSIDAAAELAKRLSLARLPVRPPVPRVRRVREIKARPTAVLRLESEMTVTPRGGYAPELPERPWVRVFFDYGGELVDPSAPAVDRVTDEEVVRVRRAGARESELLAALGEAGMMPVQRAFSGRAIPPGTSLAMSSKVSPYAVASRTLALASPEIRVEKAPGYAFDTMLADEVRLDLDELPASIDHFGVSLGIRVGDETFAALPLVLASLRERLPEEGESILVTLPDGRVVEVPAARVAPLRRLLLELLADRGSNRVSRVRALALDPAVLSRSPESLAKLREALTSPRRTVVPRKLRATLREYQRDGFGWLMARRRAHLGAVLADDMGLGKTIQTLALLLAETREGIPSLVVCPKSVLGNWESETLRFAPSLRVHVHHGPDRASRTGGFDKADVVLTTYPLLARDTDLFAARRFSTVVLDEAQTIKTAGSTFTHAACALSADFRLALSGTPMENHLGELWSVMRFTLPELFGDARAFARGFRRPIEREGSDGARAELVKRISPFLLRRRKDQVASELPPKTVIVETVELEDAQRDVYETVRAAMDARVRQALAERGMAQSHIIVLDALLKLRQAVCDPRLLPAKTAKKAGSAKLDVLVAMLAELVREGRRVLVFSQFVTMLELVQKELRREKIPFVLLTGQTENRTEVVEAFQSGAAPVFLLSLKAGGTGLNLTAADVVIHYDPWWNPAAEAQATDRAHRIGQDKPVLVYKLVGKDTIEEKILALQDKKRALFSSVLDDGAGVAKSLTAADVEFLFA